MAWLGRFQLGDWIPLTATSENTSRTPTLPTDCPTSTIYNSSGSAVASSIGMPIKDRYYTTALFQRPYRLTSSFSTGRYMVVHTFTVGGNTQRQVDCFDIVAAGDADGTTIGAYFYERPNGNFVVFVQDGGKLKQGRNPK